MTHTELNLKIKSLSLTIQSIILFENTTTWVLVVAKSFRTVLFHGPMKLSPFLTILIAGFYSSLATPEVNSDKKRYLDLWFSEFRLFVWSTGPILIWYFTVQNFQNIENIISAWFHDAGLIWPYGHFWVWGWGISEFWKYSENSTKWSFQYAYFESEFG